MPASKIHEERRGGRLLAALFWSGVGLTPLAGALLLVSRDGPMVRGAAVLALLAVVLIGLSIALRRGHDPLSAELEEALYEEVDGLRDDFRGDIATAARATHKAFGEKLLILQESIEALRGQVDALQIRLDHAAAAPQPGPIVGQQHMAGPPVGSHASGLVRHTETVVTTRQTTLVDKNESMGERGTVYGSRPAEPAHRPERTAPAVPRKRTGVSDSGQVAVAAARVVRPAAAAWPPVPVAVASAPAPAVEPAEESWTEQSLRERFANRRGAHRLAGLPDEPGDEDAITGLRASDRWASVRRDERGRELRIGERRSAVRADESGTELRIEDRWASVRRDEPRREATRRAGRDESGRDESGRDESGRDESGRDEPGGDEDTGRRTESSRRSWQPAHGWDSGNWDRTGGREASHGWDSGGWQSGSDDPGAYWSESRWEVERADEPGRWAETRQERRGGYSQPALPGPEASVSWTAAHADPGPERPTRRSKHGRDDDEEPAWPSGPGEERSYGRHDRSDGRLDRSDGRDEAFYRRDEPRYGRDEAPYGRDDPYYERDDRTYGSHDESYDPDEGSYSRVGRAVVEYGLAEPRWR